ncbi:MAGUK p55 subfamily member 7 [Plakobranchus ocellatus]|uniref:MAGUK p55 subfamily member 7 n=1 Tax=Plakobranchus ocellatus TaxID=259542 RepID=A0AAV3YL33_9GAST|nr:MAGUK p55 subfamily member 7 [Plakobranchus ocellatus]
MASSFRVIIAVLWVFFCFAALDMKSLHRGGHGRDCRIGGRIYTHGTEFFYPPNSCKLKRCFFGQLQYVNPDFPGCLFNGGCSKRNKAFSFFNGKYRCLSSYVPPFKKRLEIKPLS